MMLRVKLFAGARQLAGRDEVAVDVADVATIADVRRALVVAMPELGSILAHCRWAVNAKFINDSQPIPPASEIALIPPVSGG